VISGGVRNGTAGAGAGGDVRVQLVAVGAGAENSSQGEQGGGGARPLRLGAGADVPDGLRAGCPGRPVTRAAPGESVRVTVALPERRFAHWTESGWETEAADVTLHVGASLVDTPLTTTWRVR